LGLAIVELALQANGARLRLANRTDRTGLRAEIIWPAHAGSFPIPADLTKLAPILSLIPALKIS
jgi:hypothetical protein